MVTDHTDEPGAYAARQAQNLNVPNAAVFDTAYMQHMVQDHQWPDFRKTAITAEIRS